MITDINNEDRLVQKTFADHLQRVLGWENVYAHNEETFGLAGTLGRASDRDAVLVRDLRAAVQLLTAALAGRQPTFAIAGPSKASPTGFAAAWAELARDKANAQGAFVSAIPKPNLAKVAGLPL